MFLNRNPKNGSHFLILMTCVDPNDALKRLPMRGLVRRTTLHQCGHYMVGHVTIRKKDWTHRINLSGCYGADGLIKDVPRVVYDLGTDVPPELVEAWNNGGGWNDAGSEAKAMREWGLSLMRKEEEAKKRKPRPEPKGIMRSKEAHDYYRSLRGSIAAHLQRAVSRQMTHEEMTNDWCMMVQREPQWSRAPLWVHYHVVGAHDAIREMLYTLFLDWRVFHKEHGLVTKEEMDRRKLNYSDLGYEAGAHCWKDTGKPFNASSPEHQKAMAEFYEKRKVSNG